MGRGTGVGLVEFVGVDVRVRIWGDAAACVYEERVSATHINNKAPHKRKSRALSSSPFYSITNTTRYQKAEFAH